MVATGEGGGAQLRDNAKFSASPIFFTFPVQPKSTELRYKVIVRLRLGTGIGKAFQVAIVILD